MLAVDQQQAVQEGIAWWSSSRAYHILDGSGGTGKTFALEEMISKFIRVVPIFLAPTHKALGQLRLKVKGDYEFKTVASSLGIRPIDETKELKFEQIKLPSFWNKFNLIVCDEVSMLDNYILDLFKSLNIKILYVGHKSQLPPVKANRSMFDPCVSPVFDQGYSESHLYIPKRNVGKLWEYNENLEKSIYDSSIIIPQDYNVSRRDFIDLLQDKTSFLKGDMKIALWTREGVDKYNTQVRKNIFGEASKVKYLPDDLIIIKNNIISFDNMEHLNDRQILRFAQSGQDIYTDTDGKVISCKQVEVKLNKILSVWCNKITFFTSLYGKCTVYELLNKADYKLIADFYEHKAWSYSSKASKDKAYRERNIILKCFAKVKHYYAATSHSLQGSSIPRIITIATDINRNSNRVERAKCTYVACSRAIDDLYVYRGL